MELTKSEKRVAKEVIRKGILHRHAQWQQGLRELLDKPFAESGNEFDRSMEVTDRARKFYKEAMMMEDYYRNSNIVMGLAILYRDGHLTSEDVEILSSKIVDALKRMTEQ